MHHCGRGFKTVENFGDDETGLARLGSFVVLMFYVSSCLHSIAYFGTRKERQ